MKKAWIVIVLCGCTTARSLAPEREAGPASGRPLRAGEVNDNERFDEYLRYFKAYPERDVRKIDVTDRRVLTFVDPGGAPVSHAPVRLLAGGDEVYRAVTTAGGQVMFPPRAVGAGRARLEAVVAGQRVPVRDDGPIEIDVHQPWRDEAAVDVAFCLDTTGSMGDEIDRIKRTLRDVVARVDRLEPRPRLRFGMVVFRDRGDEYVTRRTPFTADLDRFQEALDRVRAAGGGDYEESVNEALDAAVNALDWDGGEAIRLLFLIGDAPPHSGGVDYTRSMRRAVERGIKIHTVAASGLNDRGEFIWRQIAQFTLGRFMFISYGGTTRHHVGGYVENNLDDLIARAIAAEVESLRPDRRVRRGPSEGRGREPEDFREYRGQD